MPILNSLRSAFDTKKLHRKTVVQEISDSRTGAMFNDPHQTQAVTQKNKVARPTYDLAIRSTNSLVGPVSNSEFREDTYIDALKQSSRSGYSAPPRHEVRARSMTSLPLPPVPRLPATTTGRRSVDSAHTHKRECTSESTQESQVFKLFRGLQNGESRDMTPMKTPSNARVE